MPQFSYKSDPLEIQSKKEWVQSILPSTDISLNKLQQNMIIVVLLTFNSWQLPFTSSKLTIQTPEQIREICFKLTTMFLLLVLNMFHIVLVLILLTFKKQIPVRLFTSDHGLYYFFRYWQIL